MRSHLALGYKNYVTHDKVNWDALYKIELLMQLANFISLKYIVSD